MNSWKSIGASECAPPLMTLAIGTGSTFAFGPPRYLKRGMPMASAAAFAFASDTARMAFAPGLDFVRHIFDGLGDALAQETPFVAVPQFDGFMLAGAGARRHGRAPHRAARQDDVGLDRRI